MSGEAITTTVELTLMRNLLSSALLMKFAEHFRLILVAYERLKARYGQHLDGIPAGPITIIRLRAKGTRVEGFYVTICKV